MLSGRTKRGNYAVLFALAILVVFGFGALAADVSYMRMSQSQAQDVADAASQAAAVVLKRTGDRTEAQEVAEQVVALNLVAGAAPSLEEIVFGTWAQGSGDATGSFTEDTADPNAVRVRVGRRDKRSVPFLLATVFGYQSFGVAAQATSASRNVHVILVVDITNSWNPQNFVYARDASVAFLDSMANGAGPHDKIGMTVFTGRYGWEYTPLTRLRDDAAIAAARTSWTQLKTASKAGNGTNWPAYCSLNGDPNRNNFSSPAGGCYPNMPREYTDEPGTDHTTGIEMAARMFEEDPDPSAERVMVVLTDGIPNGIASTHGSIRIASGYEEARWREYRGPRPHSTTDIKYDSIDATEALWDDMRVHTYVVSFVQDDWFLHDMPQGQGYFQLTSSASALVSIFEEIANQLPMVIVE